VFHLAEGALRRMVDDSADQALPAKKHLLSCKMCSRRADSIHGRVMHIASLFDRSRMETALSYGASLFRPRTIVPAQQPSKTIPWMQVAAAVIAVSAVGMSYAPARSFAERIAAAVREQVLRPIAITKEDAQALRNLGHARNDLAEYSPEHVYFVGYLNRGDAERAARQNILTPRYVPPSVAHGYVIYHVRGAQLYRLKIATLHATLTRLLPSIVEQTYGERQAYEAHRGLSVAGVGVLPIPQDYIDVVQQPITPMTITGSTQERVRDYFRQRASSSPPVAAALREGVDPLDHMILLRSDIQRIRQITIQGVPGYAIHNTRGFGNVLMWQKNSVMHTVEGSFSFEVLLKVAQSLRA